MANSKERFPTGLAHGAMSHPCHQANPAQAQPYPQPLLPKCIVATNQGAFCFNPLIVNRTPNRLRRSPPVGAAPRSLSSHNRMGAAGRSRRQEVAESEPSTGMYCRAASQQHRSRPQIPMALLYRAAGIGKGRAGPALARPAPAGRRSYQIATRFVLTATLQQRSRNQQLANQSQ